MTESEAQQSEGNGMTVGANPMIIAGAVVGVLLLLYLIYKWFWGGSSSSSGSSPIQVVTGNPGGLVGREGDGTDTGSGSGSGRGTGGGTDPSIETQTPTPTPAPVPQVPPFEPVFLPPAEDKQEVVAGEKLKNGDLVVIESTNPSWDRPMRLMSFDQNSMLFYFVEMERGAKFDGNWKFRVNWLPGEMAVIRDPFNRLLGWNKSTGRVDVFTEGQYDFSTFASTDYYFQVKLREVEGGVEILPGGEATGLKVDNGLTPARSMDMLRAVPNPVHAVWTIKKI